MVSLSFLQHIPPDVIKLVYAALIGLTIGIERAIKHKQASVRTYSFIAMGSCLFAMISQLAASGFNGDPTRIAANIITGIGFLGGGIIFKSTKKVEGVTSASIMWPATGFGMACGFGLFSIATWSLVVYFLILFLGARIHKVID